MTLSLAFLSLARNCASTLPNVFAFLRDLSASGVEVVSFFGENGSEDATRPLLVDAAASMDLRVVDTSIMSSVGSRFDRMATGREILREALKDSALQPDLVCVADVDSVFSAAPDVAELKGAASRLLADDTAFACSATSRPYYYDLIAFETPSENYADLVDRIRQARRNKLTLFQFMKENVYSNQIRLTRSLPERCISAFNGLCLYKTQPFLGASYLTSDEAIVCEHVTLNRRIAKNTGQQMIIDQRLFLTTPHEHAPKSFWLFVRNEARKKGWL